MDENEDENKDEKEKISVSSSSFNTTTLQRSEVETAAARGPAWTVCKYDIVTDAIATDDDSTTNLITGVVQVADMWTTKRGGDYAAWLDAAPANNEEAP